MEQGISEIRLSLSLPSSPFYEQLGYTILVEGVLDVGGGGHLRYRSGKKDLRPPRG